MLCLCPQLLRVIQGTAIRWGDQKTVRAGNVNEPSKIFKTHLSGLNISLALLAVSLIDLATVLEKKDAHLDLVTRDTQGRSNVQQES
jgi:hypothetical protein